MIRTINAAALSLALLSSCASSAAQTQGQERARAQAGQPAGPTQSTTPTQTPQAKTSARERTQSSRSTPAQAAEPVKSTAEDRQSVEVTIYNNDLGLIKERRNISVGAGEGELHFVDVPAQINPVTVRIKPLGNAGGFAVIEQNYEYDLISQSRLMEKYVGKNIRITQWNQYQDREMTVDAEVLSAGGGGGPASGLGEVYRIDGEIYLGHPGIRILPELPGNLISRPTLSWIYRSSAAREQQLEVSYLTSGMNWNADYILSVVDGDPSASGLSGWVTVNNRSGAAYDNAVLKLVAGEVNRVRPPTRAYGGAPRAMALQAETAVADAGFGQSEVFEYHIYDLQRPTTIKENQTKQISLMDAEGITVVREYHTSPAFVTAHRRGSTDNAVVQPVVAFLTFKNTQANKLGNPLPAGTVRIYTADKQGSQQFIGEDRISHTPKDEEIRLRAGEVFDIVAERTQVGFRQVTNKINESEWTVSIRNRKSEDVNVRVLEPAYGNWTVAESTHKHTKPDANTVRFDVPVKAGQEVIVKYKLRTGI